MVAGTLFYGINLEMVKGRKVSSSWMQAF